MTNRLTTDDSPLPLRLPRHHLHWLRMLVASVWAMVSADPSRPIRSAPPASNAPLSPPAVHFRAAKELGMSESHEWQDKLSTLVGELEVARQRAAKEAVDEATQVLINYAALVPYANPELLPPFARFITRRDPRSDPRYPISHRAVPPDQPVYLKALPRTAPPRNPNGTWRRDDLRRDELPYS